MLMEKEAFHRSHAVSIIFNRMGSSLLSRRVYTPEELASEAIYRTQPQEYDTLLRDGYIRGVKVERPAVISVNMLAGV